MIETVKRVVCDWCGIASTFALESESPRQVAQGEGWTESEGEDYCRQCTREARALCGEPPEPEEPEPCCAVCGHPLPGEVDTMRPLCERHA